MVIRKGTEVNIPAHIPYLNKIFMRPNLISSKIAAEEAAIPSK